VQTWSFEHLIIFSTKLVLCAPKPARTQSPKPLAAILRRTTMNIFGLNKNDNPEDIYFFRPTLPQIDTSKLFTMTSEYGKLRVQNKNVNCLFSNLTRDSFDKIYNDFNKHLNLDFKPLYLDNKEYSLTTDEQEKLFETIVTSWIYYYTINNLTIKVKRSDFTHPYMVDYVLTVVDNKYGTDTNVSLALGAKILRQALNDYTKTVKGRREYYDR
jgi:hypothetical protein